MNLLFLDDITNEHFKKFVTIWDNLILIDTIFEYSSSGLNDWGFIKLDGTFHLWYNDKERVRKDIEGIEIVKKYIKFDFSG